MTHFCVLDLEDFDLSQSTSVGGLRSDSTSRRGGLLNVVYQSMQRVAVTW